MTTLGRDGGGGGGGNDDRSEDNTIPELYFYDYTTNYSYDDLGQLTGAVHNDNALTDLTMTYDPNGNILTQNNQTYNYISGTNKVKNTDGSGNDYTYNANGNMIKSFPKNIRQIKYDAFTQMTRRILTSRNITFQYDGSNRRVFRNHRVRVYPPGGEDDATDNPVMKQKYQKGPSEEAVIKDQYSDFSPTQVESKMMGRSAWVYNNTLYLHGENAYPLVEYNKATGHYPERKKQVYIYGATGLIATYQDSVTYTIIKDHLGSTRLVLDEDWAMVSWYDYAPFGKISRSATGTKLNYRYTGQERDGEVGLMNYRARMYDSDLGRFYAMDPVAGDMPGWSPYAYSLNNPLNLIDPDGEYPWPFHIRSFISTPTVLSPVGLFGGDNREPSFAPYPEASSRVKSNFIVDPAQSYISKPIPDSDLTDFYGFFIPLVGGIPPRSEKGTSTATITNKSFGDGSASFDFHHFGKNPITPQWATPRLDVHSSLSITEDLKNGVLSITGSFTGDKFPSTEAFIVDQSGNTRVFLGAKMEEGGILNMVGDNKEFLFHVNMRIMFDGNGNFTGVQQGDQLYNIDEWTDRFDDCDDGYNDYFDDCY